MLLSVVFTGPSVSLGWWEDFRRKRSERNFKTRAHLSLRDSTCPNPKCSSHSSSIPCLLFLSASPGVLATPHLLSQMERGALKARPLEDGSCRPRWLALRAFFSPLTTQTEWDLNAETYYVLTPSFPFSCCFALWQPQIFLQSPLKELKQCSDQWQTHWCCWTLFFT